MRAAIILTALLTLPCCNSASSGPAPHQQPPTVPIATVSAAPVTEPQAPATSAAPADSGAAGHKPWIPGKPVIARGRVSDTPWQHLIGNVPGKQPDYFDLEAGGQTVVYTAKPLRCPGLVEVVGKVKEVRGSSKRPGGKPTKVDDSYGELHIDVERHRCL